METNFGNKIDSPISLALGFFDSVHLGHRAILNKVLLDARLRKISSAVFTFTNNPNCLFDADDRLVYTYDERLTIFDILGIDIVVKADFNRDFSNMSAENFLRMLSDSLNIKQIYCGYDYRFGKGRAGNTDMLKSYFEPMGVSVTVVPKIEFKDERVSTTLIKQLLTDGNIIGANARLGQNYSVSGKIEHGRGVGHIYGIPTANLKVSSEKLLPKHGVYATYSYIDGKRYKSSTNIGGKPTFDVTGVSVETMIKGLDENLYERDMKVEFVDYIRDVRKFSSPHELANQIYKDVDWR